MKKINYLLVYLTFLILGMFLFSTIAFAYIDPSAMTYIVQIIVGIVVAGGAAFAFYFRKIKRAFRKKDKDDFINNNADDNEIIDDDGEFDDSDLDIDDEAEDDKD